MTKKIIGVCGLIGSGKDTVADYLTNFQEYRRESFANSLKDAVSAVFGWDRTMLEGRTQHSREWREQVDQYWATRLAMPTLTPRWVLQYWGTEVCRVGFHTDIWVASLENKLKNSKDNIVISDCRFPNEIDAIVNAGGKIIWVQRGELPSWYQTAMLAVNGCKQSIETMNQTVHPSEWSWLGCNFDAIIDNNGTIDALYQKLAAQC